MKIVGVVAEYNPFHQGHLYHLNKIKTDLKPDAVVCVMSGNFVQRGEPAIFNKWARAEMALAGGVDLVIELPVCFSTATAEIFAESAVRLLYQTGVVNYISFGIEENCKEELLQLGKLLSQEPLGLKEIIKSHLNEGITFAAAREKAVLQYLLDQDVLCDINLLSRLLKKPNFILALEYIKAIHRLGANIKTYPILRQSAGYHDNMMNRKYPSATAIRAALKSTGADLNAVANSIPKSSFDIICREVENRRGPVFIEDFQKMLLYILRRLSVKEMRAYFDVGEGLEHRIKRASTAIGTDQIISQIKAKRYPETKVKRILIHMLLDIQRPLVDSRTPLYLRVLGFSRRGAKVLRKIKKESTTPILTRTSDYKKLPARAMNMFEKDLFAAQIYFLACENPINWGGTEEFQKNVIYFASDK